MNVRARFGVWQFDINVPQVMHMTAFRPGNRANVPLRQATRQEPPGSQLPIDVRAVKVRDLFSLSTIGERYPLDLPNGECFEIDPVRIATKQLMPMLRHDRPLLVARSDRGIVAYATFAVIGPDQRWVLQGVGSRTGIYEPEPIWEELFRYAVISAGLDGTKRLFARMPVGTSVLAAARKVGFAPYVSESIWAASLVPVTRPGRYARRQQQADVWSIHQLYMSAVPRQVQYAEAVTSHSWDLNAQQLPNGASCRGWLVEDGHMVCAYARVISYPRAHTIEFLVDPDHREVLGDLLSTVFAELGRLSARRIYVTLRGYQGESAAMLEQFGLVPHLEQDVHIKYTTAPVKAPMVTVSPFATDVKEPSAKRVPTFLHGSHSDPTSETLGSS